MIIYWIALFLLVLLLIYSVYLLKTVHDEINFSKLKQAGP